MPLYQHKRDGDGDGDDGDPPERRRTAAGSIEDERLAASPEVWELVDESSDQAAEQGDDQTGEQGDDTSSSSASSSDSKRRPRGPSSSGQADQPAATESTEG